MTIPSDIAGLNFWLKADSLSLSDNDPVGTWPDLSASANDAVQATSGRKPIYKTGVLNGKPGVRFDGVDDYLTASATLTVGSMLAAYRYNSGGNGFFKSYDALVSGAGSGVAIIRGGSGGSDFRINGPPDGFFGVSGSPDTFWIDGVNTNSPVPFDDYHYCSGTVTNPPYPPQSVPGLEIGRDTGDDSRAWVGDLLELISYDTVLSTGDRQSIETYLNTRYFTAGGVAIPVIMNQYRQRWN